MTRDLLTASFVLLCACGGELAVGSGGAGGGGGAGGQADESFPLACDPLVPSFCGYPFPSDVYAVDDASTVTGKRVAFKSEGLPQGKDGHVQDTGPWQRSDGFSASAALVAEFPGATGEGLPSVLDIAASLDDAAPTIILDLETGERIAHWAELDRSKDFDPNPSLLIHPAAPLRDGKRYIVAVRGLVDGTGAPIEPSPAFASLRNGTASSHSSVEARRGLYAEIFGALESAGVLKDDLLLAWDFTTASRESNTGWLLHMRDEALEITGDDGPTYTITSVDSDLDPANIMFRIKGMMHVPLYLDQPDVGATLLFGDDGMPEPNPAQPMYDIEFELLIPNIAATTPVGLLQHGHGLFGDDEQIESEHFRTFCNTFGYAIFSTRLVGMAEDSVWVIEQLVEGKMDAVTHMYDRLHQGFLNNLLVMRMMSRRMTADPDYGALLDGSRRYYWGISQGGIQGGVTMSLSPDIERGVLEVMGQPYNTLLNRSVDFTPFFTIVGLQFPDSRSQQHLLGALQMLWDRVEPSGYTKYTFSDPFPGSPPGRRVLMRTAVGDHQVTTFGGHVMARAMGAKHLDSGVRDIYGLEKVTAQTIDDDVAVYTEYDFGLPPEPNCNLPQFVCDDPHGKLRSIPASRTQNHTFFSTGVFSNDCDAQVCSFPELSGCTGNEPQDACE